MKATDRAVDISSSTNRGQEREQKRESTANVSSTKETEVARPTATFPILDLKGYDISERPINYIQVNHVIENPKIVNAETEENLKRA